MTTHILYPNNSTIHKNGDKKYTISCSIFKEHDHKNKPLYYYHDRIKNDDLVHTVEGNDTPQYDSPYSGIIEDNGVDTIFRENVIIEFQRTENLLHVKIKNL